MTLRQIINNLIMKKTILLIVGFSFLTIVNHAQTVTDYDSNVYNYVTIGTQTWMKENLKAIHYNNGDLIDNISGGLAWSDPSLISGARCYYNNDSSIYANTYGALYNWYATTDSRMLCPIDWHIPSKDEWFTLVIYLGSDIEAGGKMKETGLSHWLSPNSGATNESNFTALPGGLRVCDGGFFNLLGQWACFWSSTFDSVAGPFYENLHYNDPYSGIGNNNANGGFSIRCIKDSTNQINKLNYNINVQIYPNPSNDIVYINYTENKIIKMQVYNTIGECILQKILNKGINDFDISSLSKGIYIVKLTGSDWTSQTKLIKK